jgi:hypothetical protein
MRLVGGSGKGLGSESPYYAQARYDEVTTCRQARTEGCETTPREARSPPTWTYHPELSRN